MSQKYKSSEGGFQIYLSQKQSLESDFAFALAIHEYNSVSAEEREYHVLFMESSLPFRLLCVPVLLLLRLS